MDNLRLQIDTIFKGAAKSFYRFPAAIISAIVISITAIVKISLDFEVQQTYNFLFNSIQISFLLAAVFSMAVVILEEVKSDERKSYFILANVSGIILAIISFLLLYFFGGRITEYKTVYLSSIAMARVSAAIFVSVVAFIYMISKAKFIDSFSNSFFITHRAFIISTIYGSVIMIGVSGVLGAFQALVYKGMDYRIYQYLGVAVGFLTYTIFLGYFPSFKSGEDEEEIKNIKEQPRFIFVLFEYILIPIIMALTVVLLIWSARVVSRGIDVSFNQLSGIASSYVIIGIWLHIMVSKHQTKLAYFYKKAYPFAGILILIFQAWALFVQLNKLGLRTAEYSFLMIWIFAIVSVLLIIFLKEKAYRKIAITISLIAIVWVLPIIGYQDITFNSQVSRLNGILINQGLLVNDEIKPTNKEIEHIKKGEITESVDFISYSEKKNTPNWFKKDLNDDKIFKETFGFEKTYGVYLEPSDYKYTNFTLETEVIDISDYNLSLRTLPNEGADTINTFEGENGSYEIIMLNESSRVPKFTIKLDDKIILEENLDKYLEDLLDRYSSEENRDIRLAFEDMSVVIEEGDISILIVFNNINAYFEKTQDKTNYYVELHGIFVKYK